MTEQRSKVFVLDTNVLLHDPQALFQFPRHQVILPVTVLEELDRLKRLPSGLGKNAREIFRLLDSLSDRGQGDLHHGVELENGTVVRVALEMAPLEEALSSDLNDNKILATAQLLQRRGERVIFVSKDFAARIKAEALGLAAQDYENLKFSYRQIYKGIQSIQLEKLQIDQFYKDGYLPWSELLAPNEYGAFYSSEQSFALGRYDVRRRGFVSLSRFPSLWGVEPRNQEQTVACDLLMRQEIQLVSLMGPAGTGKTLLALAAALYQVFDLGLYSRILVSRPIVPMGRDIGYLPGTKEEKLVAWMQPIYDNLEYLCHSGDSDKGGSRETYSWVTRSDRIEMEAVTYIRGRSLPKMFMIVDEAQNLTPHEIKTIISRAGEGTKVVLTGDATQIDNPYLDENSNGLTYTVAKFKGEPLFGHILLEKTERSQLAARAAAIL